MEGRERERRKEVRKKERREGGKGGEKKEIELNKNMSELMR
jgi:hypothetical protein